jgi:hypothetical protein
MQTVSSQFEDNVEASVKTPQWGFLISWLKNIAEDAKFAQVGHSFVDGPDKVKGSGDTIAFFDKYDYQNESAYVQNFRVTRKISNRPWGVIMAQAEITLNNTTKRFMPDFDEDIGAYVALPDRPVKLSVGYQGEFVKLFTGYTDRPEIGLNKRLVKLRAFDAMTYLSTVKSDESAFVDKYWHEIIEELLLEQGFAEDQFDLEPSLQLPIGYLMPKDRYVTDIFQEGCEAEGYILFADEDGIIKGWNRLHLIGDRDPLWSFTYSNLEDIDFSSAPIINSAITIAKPFKPAAFNVLYELSDASDQTLIPPGGSKDIFANFQDDLGPFLAISVEDPVHVSESDGGSSYSTNMAQDGSANPGAQYVDLASTFNFGDTYRMTFTNSHPSMPIYITKIRLFGQPAKVTAVKSDIQERPVSIEDYGLNPDNNKEVFRIENSLIQDTATANTMAWLLVDIFSNAHGRLNVDNFVVPHMQFGDPVEVEVLDTEETKTCNVMGMELFMGVNANIKQKLYLEEFEQKVYARVGHSKTDGPDHVAL